mgnify:FL=1
MSDSSIEKFEKTDLVKTIRESLGLPPKEEKKKLT